MTKIEILIEGYAKKLENGWLASSTVTLIESNGKKIIVDPGCNRPKLKEKLSENNLTTGDIDYVLLTHNHTDHILLSGIFENAKVLNESEIYDNDQQIEHGNAIHGTDIKIIQTPGHDQSHCAFIVPCKDGTYVVAGDVFWWMDDEEQKTDLESLLSHDDPYVEDKTVLENSRKQILEIADFVVPGHGKMFKVEKK
jgi:glyoxylase-like metal-dependent hydrolase (beta-lactamase superfamily II)